jgi:hypothetical protein
MRTARCPSLPVDGPQGGTMKILAHKVESIQEFCGSPLSTQKDCEMKVGKNDAGLMRLLRKTAKLILESPPRSRGKRVWRAGGSSPKTCKRSQYG